MFDEVDPRQAQDLLSQDDIWQILDVREPWEYEKGHIEGSRLIPLGELPTRLEELERDRPVLCVCAGGVRSEKAAKILTGEGFGRVTNMLEGMKGWSSEQLPVVL